MTPGLLQRVLGRRCSGLTKENNGQWMLRQGSDMGNSPAGEVARTLLALLVLRYGQLTGGGRSAHFTCFTGTKVQILT
jgi:hypothetical protein